MGTAGMRRTAADPHTVLGAEGMAPSLAAPLLPPRSGVPLSTACARDREALERLRDFAPHAAKLDTNDHLRLASTFSGLSLIMKQLSPVKGSSQMLELECDGFVLQSFDTQTGLKFFCTADPDSRNLEALYLESATARYELAPDHCPW